MKVVIAILLGAMFAAGLVISGMTVPGKVTAFLDIGGAWNPALAFVMASAITVFAPLAWLASDLRRPVLDTRWHYPPQRRVDVRLIGGALIFGVGWGLSGYCPGSALVSVTSGWDALAFVAAMIVGIAIARRVQQATGTR
ncbi:MAG: DUF6691 family protein [Kofleriaceae bacterium]